MKKSKYILLREYAVSNRDALIEQLNDAGLNKYETGLLMAYDDMVRMSYVLEATKGGEE